jgi:hypothetical protein
VEVDFQRAVVSMPTITPPILPSHGFSVRDWRCTMGMAIVMEFYQYQYFYFKKSYFATFVLHS